MTNYEYYREQIEKFTRLGLDFGIDKTINKINLCKSIECTDCKFFRNCAPEKLKWADEEYKEPEVDWSKVAVDTPILVRDDENEKWLKRHFVRYEDGNIYAWNAGRTSWSTSDEAFVIKWKYAKLAEDENEK